MQTYDKFTIDSTGAFLIGELERFDPTLNAPLVSYKWSRDIQLREDVSIADELSSFSNTTFAAAGGINPTGKSWVGKTTNAITGIALDLAKTSNPLFLWAMELGYTIPELMSAQQVGRPIDSQKLEGIQLKHQMDIDEMVYIGDSNLGKYGLLNSDKVTSGFVAQVSSPGTMVWSGKTPVQILADVNTLLYNAWAASGFAVCPDKLGLPPKQFAYIYAQIVSISGVAGGISIGKFLEDNSICMRENGRPLEIVSMKWLTGRGTAISSPATATDRMIAYTNDKKYVRYPMVPLQRTPLEYRSIYHLTTYFGRLGCVEFPYPETCYYSDGI